MTYSFSIIIPTFNEEEFIGPLLDFLLEETRDYRTDIVVCDGGSTDLTLYEVERRGVRLLQSAQKGRGSQLNLGARSSKGEVLYFLHADTFPPTGFLHDITRKLNEGYPAGCFRLSFDWNHWFLRANAWLTRFNVNYFRFGDQSLFIQRDSFERAGGYRDDYLMLEDQEIIHRIKKRCSFAIIPRAVVTSARKYRENGPLRLQWIFLRVWLKYKSGKSQAELLEFYKQKINDHKLEKDDATIIRPLTTDLYKEPHSGTGENTTRKRPGASSGG